jgi:hypothetical protein
MRILMVDCPYTRLCDKITRVITSCVNMEQLVVAKVYCWRLIRKFEEMDGISGGFPELYLLKSKIYREQRCVISKTSKIV